MLETCDWENIRDRNIMGERVVSGIQAYFKEHPDRGLGVDDDE